MVSAPDPRLVTAVARAIADAWAWPTPSWDDVGLAAIAAIHAHEVCSRCGASLVPPVLCADCAADTTPPMVADPRGTGTR